LTAQNSCAERDHTLWQSKKGRPAKISAPDYAECTVQEEQDFSRSEGRCHGVDRILLVQLVKEKSAVCRLVVWLRSVTLGVLFSRDVETKCC
jgi:hypothetical protein